MQQGTLVLHSRDGDQTRDIIEVKHYASYYSGESRSNALARERFSESTAMQYPQLMLVTPYAVILVPACSFISADPASPVALCPICYIFH